MEPDYFRDEQDEKDFEAEIPLDEEEEEEAQRTTVSENLSTEEELENVKKKLKEIEEETGNLRQKSALIEKEIGGAAEGHENSTGASDDGQSEKEEVDSRSIYVGNVDYECTPEEVQQHFLSCGTVNRVTILTDQFGQPKGFAYVEFVETEAVQNALMLNESELHGRPIKVMRKRTNIPGMKQHRGRPSFRRGFTPGPLSHQSYSYGRVPRYRRPTRYSPY
ncbi:polyadenylate-binding protein 1 [Coffea eugenioides]|uniref:Polyadenylate-binding protein 1 n=1 Tax=Coffea arabica TaxID=13443 RepID=A0A6P6VXU8_COFAR|nr:polyadenylate-binding protein 1-like [Coffea arabica]XP_027182978.1 polyadenylate-binding protein 1 [Coffea eugenioides]